MRRCLLCIFFFLLGGIEFCLAQDSTVPSRSSTKHPSKRGGGDTDSLVRERRIIRAHRSLDSVYAVIRTKDSLRRVRQTADSLFRLRKLRRRRQDSIRRIRRRDSLLGGEEVHIKGRSYTLQDSAGQKLFDSLGKLLRLPPVYSDSGNTSGLSYLIKKASPKTIKRKVNYEHIPFFVVAPEGRNKALLDSIAFASYLRKYVHLDSISALYVFPLSPKKKPYYDPHRPLAAEGSPRLGRPVWILWVLLIAIATVAVVRAIYPRDLYDVFQALFNDRLIKSSRESDLAYTPSLVLMFSCFCLCCALLIFDYLSFLKMDLVYHGFVLYSIICCSVLFFFLLKLVTYRLMATVFQIEAVIIPYLTLLYVTIVNFTLLIIPFLSLFAFLRTDWSLYMAQWIPYLMLILPLFLYIRGVIFLLTNFEFPKLYLFIYFCAFEICPLIVVFKLVSG